ncbi:MAG: 2-oxoacid:acceptor oxidoreductase subunit alpha [bacterium]
MSSGSTRAEEQPSRADRSEIVNDFSIVAATANGSGSQTSNTVILRALFDMGIPVSGKNLFPSNIKGLPTWFTIRVSRDGYGARRDPGEIVIAMNPETADEDMAGCPEGGMVLYPDDWTRVEHREGVTYYPMPVKAIVKEVDVAAALRPYVSNMVYVGVLAELLDIDMKAIRGAIQQQFPGKKGPVDLNMGVIESAAEWTRENTEKQDPFRVEPMDATEGLVLIEGNTAAAMGAMFGGCQVISWYPITPSTGLVDSAKEYFRDHRHAEDGESTYAIIQAEDELAAIGMVIGAGWAGARAMTSTSGPGISLMSEFTGLAYFAEIPAVIWDVQRMGPSTGMPTRTSQGDILSTYYLSHGDTRHVLLLPGDMKEIFEFGWRAFDLAERLQTPVFCMSDLDFGMNLWMSEPFEYPDTGPDRGKVLSADDLEELEGDWGRYRDVDGDGIPYRTLPGTDHPSAAYFTRGSGHNADAGYTERPDEFSANMQRLFRKFETARDLVPPPVVDDNEGAEIGLVYYGSSWDAVREARAQLDEQGGPATAGLRLRALPVNEEVRSFIDRYDRVYVVENNWDGQAAIILRSEYPGSATKIHSICKADGLPLTASWVRESLLEEEEGR